MSEAIKDEDKLDIIKQCIRILSKGVMPGDAWDDPELEKWMYHAGMDCEDHVYDEVGKLEYLNHLDEDELSELGSNLIKDLWKVWQDKKDHLLVDGDDLNEIISMAIINIDKTDLP